ncbi:hypothetical protein [Piscinibacter sakaiensis]|uniref:hypothetical protein n=1 Tax=Piscinibacter sakaiensis TaxID=1547922 RepID=UPI003AAA8E3F
MTPATQRPPPTPGNWHCLLAGAGLLVCCSEAWAQGTAVVLGQSLAWVGLLGGAVAGAVSGFLQARPAAFWPAFGIYLGLLAMLASTRAGSLEIVPLALVFGAVAGIVPFAAAWFGVRWCWRRWRSSRQR